MKNVIADTSAIISLLSPTDSNHRQTVALREHYTRERGAVIVPPDVFTETMNVLGRRAGHADALAAAAHVRAAAGFLVVEPWGETVELALEIFRTQPESVSFTDCMVMATADHYGTRLIFGFDEVFRKNGYVMQEEAEAA
jgi:predicted nucleic acid-binding protein